MLLRYAVATMATLLAFGVCSHAWRQRTWGLGCLAGWLGTVAAAAWILALPESLPVLHNRLLIGLLNTLAAPLLFGYVLHAVRGARLSAWAFAPFALHALVALVFGTALVAWISVPMTIGYEWLFTAMAWVVYARSPARRGDLLPVLGVLVAVTALHAAQAIQILRASGVIETDYVLIRHAVFIVVGFWLLVAMAIALFESPWLKRLAPVLAPVEAAADQALLLRIERIMTDQRPWADPELEVGALATMLDTSPNAVSRALSRAGGTTYYDLVNLHRVREAERLLLDPAEARFKVEALGRQAGFRSRSTFFKLFRAHTGLTPAEYRAARGIADEGESSPPAP